MKALTVCQPYATLIARGLKRVENRTWPAPNNAIWKPIAIHAGKSKAWLNGDNYGIAESEMPFGFIVATARLADCISLTAADLHPEAYEKRLNSFGWNLKDFLDHEHTEGPFCWVLDRIQPLAEPIPYSGAQGLWLLPDEVLPATPTPPGDAR